jgi:hypothetical protein
MAVSEVAPPDRQVATYTGVHELFFSVPFTLQYETSSSGPVPTVAIGQRQVVWKTSSATSAIARCMISASRI